MASINCGDIAIVNAQNDQRKSEDDIINIALVQNALETNRYVLVRNDSNWYICSKNSKKTAKISDADMKKILAVYDNINKHAIASLMEKHKWIIPKINELYNKQMNNTLAGYNQHKKSSSIDMHNENNGTQYQIT